MRKNGGLAHFPRPTVHDIFSLTGIDDGSSHGRIQKKTSTMGEREKMRSVCCWLPWPPEGGTEAQPPRETHRAPDAVRPPHTSYTSFSRKPNRRPVYRSNARTSRTHSGRKALVAPDRFAIRPSLPRPHPRRRKPADLTGGRRRSRVSRSTFRAHGTRSLRGLVPSFFLRRRQRKKPDLHPPHAPHSIQQEFAGLVTRPVTLRDIRQRTPQHGSKSEHTLKPTRCATSLRTWGKAIAE